MKIILVCNNFGAKYDGIGAYAEKIYNSLIVNGSDVKICTAYCKANEMLKRIFTLGMSSAIFRATKDILFEKPDIFIYETVQRYIPNLLEASQRVMSSLPAEIKIDAPVIKEPLFHEALDLAGYSEDGRSFDVVGWSYIEEKDTRNQEKFIRLTLANGENLVPLEI